jgi:MFS family permease
MELQKNPVSKPVVLFITMLSSFLTPFMASSITIAMPVIGREFSINAVMLSWVATAFLLSAAAFLVPFGKIADIYGRKKIYTIGIFIFGFANLAAALSPTATFLIIVRTVQGLGASMIFGTALAILTSVYPANQRGRVLGFNLAATYLGLSLGPFAGGLLTYYFGWRSIFFVSFILIILIVPLIFWKLKDEWAEAKGEKFDLRSAFVYMTGLLLIMYGFPNLVSWYGLVLFSCGIVIIAIFLRLQKSASFPILDLSHFKTNTIFIFSNLAAFINYSATFAVGFLLSLYLQYILGLNPQKAGLVLVTQPLVMAVFSPLAGRLSDKIEPQIVASIGMGLTVLGLLPFIFLGFHTGIPFIVITLFLIGTGFALFSSPNTNAIMSSVERKFYGVASASVGTMRLTGQAISMGIVTLIFTVVIGKVKISTVNYPQFIQGVRIAFMIFSILCTAGVFASLARGKLRLNQ